MGAPVFDAALRGLFDLLAPRTCPGCDLALDPGEDGFCGACEPLLEPLPETETRNAAYAFGGPLADAIRRVKYGRRTDHVAPLARLLASSCASYAGRVDAVVPIPLHPLRLRDRGFDQAALLAGPVARSLGARLADGALVRLRDTPAQAGLAMRARADNVRGCFSARVPRGVARVLVIDDVRTTGATFADAARALREAGVIEIHAMALAGADRL